MNDINKVKIKDISTFRKSFIVIDDNTKYKRCRVQLHRKGIVLRDEIFGKDIKTKKQRLCHEDDFLVAEMDAKFGGYGIVPKELNDAIVSSHYYLFEIDKMKMKPSFLSVLMDTNIIQDQIKAKGSTNYSRVSPSEVSEFEIPCPPIQKQEKIIRIYSEVKIIAKEFICASTTQTTLLTQLRQSILQEAIEGKLTADWRASTRLNNHQKNKLNHESTPIDTNKKKDIRVHSSSFVVDDLEYASASVLLEHIKVEKEKLVAEGKIKKQKPLAPIKPEEIPFELPAGWVWTRLGEIISYSEAGKSFLCTERPIEKDEWGVVKVSSISWGEFREQENKFYRNTKPTDIRFQIKENDFLISRANTSSLVGKSVIVRSVTKNLLLSDKIIRFHFLNDTSKEFVNLLNNSRYTREYFAVRGTGSSPSMKNITRIDMNEWLFPLPPLAEQKAIVERVDKLLAMVDDLEKQVAGRKVQAEQLMQSVLREAFAG